MGEHREQDPKTSGSSEDGGPRTIRLPGGRGLVVRDARPDDLGGLTAFYAALPVEDLYHRFFSAFRPTADVLEEWLQANPTERRRLVAVRSDPVDPVDPATRCAGRAEVVADAGYVRLPDGDAEFDLAVAPDARGWLGPYLLALLVDRARADGIPNLRADVLIENRAMLALIDRYRHVVRGHDDHTVVHVALAVRAETPVWPPRRRALRVVAEGWGLGWSAPDAARSYGMELVVCPSPTTPAGSCPALAGRPCPLVQQADAVVYALARDEPAGPCLLRRHAELHGDTPLLVRGASAPDGAPLPPGATAFDSDGELPLQTVGQLLGHPAALPHRHRTATPEGRRARTPLAGARA